MPPALQAVARHISGAARSTPATPSTIRTRIEALRLALPAAQQQVDKLTQQLITTDDTSIDAAFHAAKAKARAIIDKIESLELALEEAEQAERVARQNAAKEATKELRKRAPAKLADIAKTEGARFDALAAQMIDCISKIAAQVIPVVQDTREVYTKILPQEQQRGDALTIALPDAHGEAAANAIAGFMHQLRQASHARLDHFVSFNQFGPGISGNTMQDELQQCAVRLANRLTDAAKGQ
jgi:hypothetical protein